MKEFITRLYADENFPVYLGIAIVVLVVLFIVVYFVGKKDQENIEKTKELKALQTQDPNAFKETTTPAKVETPVNQVQETFNPAIPPQNIATQVQMQTPATPSIPVQIAPVQMSVSQQPVNNVNINNNQQPQVVNTYSQPVQHVASETVAQPNVVKEVPPVTPIIKEVEPSEIELPKQEVELEFTKMENTEVIDPTEIMEDINTKKIEEISEPKKANQTQVFSSVYVPKKPIEQLDPDATMAIELPKLKDMAILQEEEESKLNV